MRLERLKILKSAEIDKIQSYFLERVDLNYQLMGQKQRKKLIFVQIPAL